MKNQSLIFLFIFLFSTAHAQKANTIASGGAKSASAKELTDSAKRASESIQSYEDFASQNGDKIALLSAANASIQFISKCSLIKDKKGNAQIKSSKGMFCPPHPLSKYGSPKLNVIESQDSKEKVSNNPMERKCSSSKPCSGVLAGNQKTIATSGHCLGSMTPQQMCEEYVVVFNRTESKHNNDGVQSFSKDEIFECDGGLKAENTSAVKDFNLHSDQESKDHAFLTLKRSVPKSTATAVQFSSESITEGSDLYAVGYPGGSPRTVSTLKDIKVTKNSSNKYGYIQGTGYAYQGNSGGPLLDSQGRLVGILSSVDDNKAGPPVKREPMVQPEGTKGLCRIQKDNALTVESVSIGTELRSMYQRVNGPSMYKPDNSASEKTDAAY